MTSPTRSSLERLAVVAATTALLSMVWAHALTAWLGPSSSSLAESTLPAWPLTISALAVGLLAGAARRVTGGFVAGVVGAGALFLAGTASVASALALLVLGPVLALVGRVLELRWPRDLDGLRYRRPRIVLGAAALILLAFVQVGRLSTYMADPSSDWFLSTRDPLWAKHECMTAYLFAAELNERGEDNVYDARHYPGLNPAAEPVTDMQGMAVEDPFQYPPQFLLLPTLARALSHDFTTVRLVWYALQASLFLTVAWALALWVGGREGRRAAMLIPLALTAFPALHALQYGQFHLAAVVLSLAALLAFERRRTALGGAMLAIAISAKLFPGLLLLPLVIQRRWRALAWTAGFGLGFALLGWIVLGPAPYLAFLDYQLPRLANGQAFAFGEAWPEIRELMIADNQGAFGLVLKLKKMGLLSASSELARRVGMGFGLGALLLTAWFARREATTPRHLRVAGWLAILGLGSLASPGAFGDYVPLTATWVLTFLVASFGRGWRWTLPLGGGWLFQYTLLGTTPIGSWMDPKILIPLSSVGAVSLLALFLAVVGGLFAAGTARTAAKEPVDPRVSPLPLAAGFEIGDLSKGLNP